jgi:hypothetical protein
MRRIFWIRVSRHHPAAEQERAAVEWRADVVLRDGHGHETWDALVRKVARKGDLIGMTTLARIGSTRDDVQAGLAAAHAKGCVIEETRTGRRTDHAADAAQMAMDAASEITDDARRLSPKQARSNAAKRWNEKARERLAKVHASKIWHDTTTYRLIPDALRHMPGWTRSTAYRKLGERGTTLGGRPRTKKQD